MGLCAYFLICLKIDMACHTTALNMLRESEFCLHAMMKSQSTVSISMIEVDARQPIQQVRLGIFAERWGA